MWGRSARISFPICGIGGIRTPVVRREPRTASRDSFEGAGRAAESTLLVSLVAGPSAGKRFLN